MVLLRNRKQKMKIAIFHNALDNIGGAEIVDLIMARELGADIYTTNIDEEKIKKLGFSTKNIYSIGKVPINAPFRQEAIYWKFRFLNIEKQFNKKYDFYIIAGDWAMPAAINHKPNFWYVFSPTREIWDLYEYVRRSIQPRKITGSLNKYLFNLWVFYRRLLNRYDSKKINNIVAISKNVQKRIKKYLNKNSIVIYPPTETKKYKFRKHKNYWLSVNRLINHKRVDLQLKAFSKIPKEKLIIIGSYEPSLHFQKYVDYIKKIKPKNVEIKSWVSNKELIKLYSECKGLIASSKDEDYGMNAVEAMASGKLVIAPNEGGYKETVTNKTGILINNINKDKIVNAIKLINKSLEKNPDKYKKFCIAQAKKFNTKIFIKKIKKEIEKF